MTCSSCKNLNEKKKADGAVSGCKYECKKLKAYVLGSNEACPKYEKCYRDVDTCNKIYNEGRNWDNDNHSPSFYLIIAIILIIILFFVYIFNPSLF